MILTCAFQSRNRESFDFKSTRSRCNRKFAIGFNLVIESLLISSAEVVEVLGEELRRFNLVIESLLISSAAEAAADNLYKGFNLVIESLLISRKSFHLTKWRRLITTGFNLVIESLLISRKAIDELEVEAKAVLVSIS